MDGYWDCNKFANLVENFLDWFDAIFPGYQFLLDVDNSSGHTKKKYSERKNYEFSMGWQTIKITLYKN